MLVDGGERNVINPPSRPIISSPRVRDKDSISLFSHRAPLKKKEDWRIAAAVVFSKRVVNGERDTMITFIL